MLPSITPKKRERYGWQGQVARVDGGYRRASISQGPSILLFWFPLSFKETNTSHLILKTLQAYTIAHTLQMRKM
jgi:hypothetical protein